MEGVTEIGGEVFRNCTSLTEIKDLGRITSIPSYLFADCTQLTSISIPASVTNAEYHAFYGCPNLTNVYITDLGAWCSLQCAGSYSTPMDYAKHLYLNGELLTDLVIPDGVKVIRQDALYNCTDIQSITVPESVTTIGRNAFGSDYARVTFLSSTPCTQDGLGTDIHIAVPKDAYEAYCKAWPDCADVIVAAEYTEWSVEVTAKESSSAVAEAIGENLLRHVMRLKVTGTINSYDVMVFRNKMVNLEELDLEDAHVESSEYAYWSAFHTLDSVITGCFVPNNITALKLPKDTKEIGSYAFAKCSRLKKLELPEGVKSIGMYAFDDCSDLRSVNLPEGLTAIQTGTFYYCTQLDSVKIPESVTSIGYQAFESCFNLKEIHLPTDLKTIEDGAFRDCYSLKELHLPPYLESIGDNAFSGCSNLKDIYAYMPSIIPIGTGTFSDYAHQELYVPEFLYNSYYYDTNWSQFLSVNKTSLSPDDYVKVPTNSDIVFADGDERIPEKSDGTPVDGDLKEQGSFTVEGAEPQPFDTVEQNSDGEGLSGSLIGEGDTEETNNLPVNTLLVKIQVKANRWYFFCFPFDVTIAECAYPGQYAWREYSGDIRARQGSGGWQNVEGEKLMGRKGYIFQSSDAGTLVVKLDKPTFGGDRPKVLDVFASNQAANANWNLVGNPYSSYYDFVADTYAAPITVWDGTSYQAYRPGDDDYHLQPYEAFFVQKPEDVETIDFMPEHRETYRKSQEAKNQQAKARRARGIDAKRHLVNLSIGTSETETCDRTRVVLNEEASRDYELTCDAAKFMSSNAAAQLYTVETAGRMAINERPTAGDIRLGYVAQRAGTLCIGAQRMDLPLVLVDTQTGITSDLSLGNYTFHTDAGTFDQRFLLRPAGEATAIQQLAKATGVAIGLQDGGLNIGGAEGKSVSIYTTGGTRVASLSGNGFVGLPNGIYIAEVDGQSAKVYVK